jgi:hypothetical protein
MCKPTRLLGVLEHIRPFYGICEYVMHDSLPICMLYWYSNSRDIRARVGLAECGTV